MATGASVADLALVLVSADDGLTRQSKRHVVILSMLGVRKLVLAVNKMDRVAWSQDAFDAIAERFRAFTAGLGFEDIVCIPLAANSGDNVVARSARMEWYRGPTLLEHLEQVDTARRERPPRLPHAGAMGQPAARGFSRL